MGEDRSQFRTLVLDAEPSGAETVVAALRAARATEADPTRFRAAGDALAAAETGAYDVAFVEIPTGASHEQAADRVERFRLADPELAIVAFGRDAADHDLAVRRAGALDWIEGSALAAPVLARSFRLAGERKRSLEEVRGLARTQRAFRTTGSVFDQMRHAVFAIDEDGDLVFSNAAAEALLGAAAASSTGQPFVSVVDVDHRVRVLRALERSAAGHCAYGVECQVGSNGAPGRWTELDFSPWERGHGRPAGALVVGKSVSDRHPVRLEAQKQEEELQATLASVLDNVPVGILIADASGRPKLVNRVARDLLGMNALLPLDRWPQAGVFLRPDGQAATERDLPALKTLRDGIARREIEMHVARPGGEPVPLLVNTDATRDAAGGIFEVSCSFTDISVRRHIETQLRQAQKMEAIGTLASGIAHDFNNVLCAILGYSELLLKDLPEGQRHARLAGEIAKAGERASGLTRQLLSFSRREVLAPEVLDLSGQVRDMQSLLQRLLGDDIELTSSLADDAGRVLVDPSHIAQILMNLAVNARDAMPRGGALTLETRHEVIAPDDRVASADPPPGDYVLLSVRDTGSGMDEATLSRLFEPFFTTKERGKGTGLGLSTVYGILKQNGGHIRVESQNGKGSTFRIYLPRAEEPAAAPAKRRAPAHRAHEGRPRVLLVEDEAMVRALIVEILEMAGYAVTEASNGEDALAICEGDPHPIDALVTDVVMPVMNGSDLAERVQSFRPAMRVLFVSGHTSDALLQYGVAERRVAFLRKPFSPAELTDGLRALLAEGGRARFSRDRPLPAPPAVPEVR